MLWKWTEIILSFLRLHPSTAFWGFPGGSDSKASACNVVPSLGWEDPLAKEMAIHSSTLVWKIPGTEESGRLQSMGWQRVRHDWGTSFSLYSITLILCCILVSYFRKLVSFFKFFLFSLLIVYHSAFPPKILKLDV